MGKARRKFDIAEYDFYVKEFIRKSEENGTPISHSKLRLEPFSLPDARWYITNCPDKSVDSWAKFVAWCGFYTHGAPLSKERATELIYKMQEQIGRPLMYDDFRGRACYRVPIEYIRQTWGSINKMKEALGLEIIQESMIEKQLSKEDFDNTVQNIINFIKSEDRNFTTTREIDDNKNWASYSTLDRMSKKYYNISFTEHIKTFGIVFGKQGNGLTYDFKDGEHVTSQFEYMFSKYLKENGFEYNKSYVRDIKYRDFIPTYKGNMNCDYVIDVDGTKLYIEIAGIIADYKTWYYENKPITYSKSKEKYRLKLTEKEQMLKDNGLNYFILFPCDLTKENFENILFNRSTELKGNIEQFHKNNIDWNKVRKIGELDYSQDIIREDKRRKKYRKEAV